MFFNSLSFVGFFFVVYATYLCFQRSYKVQNVLLMIASYFFYGCWNYKFLFLLAFSTFLDYYCGLRIHQATDERERKRWLMLSIIVSFVILGFFKYYNFFIDSMAGLLDMLGWHVSPWILDIVLPVGISFYTFHGISYVVDIYNRKFVPVKSYIDYSLFVCFYPLLVAGPIERATHLLPQIVKPRKISADQVNAGIYLIIWGFFKKVVIADNVGIIADEIFNKYYTYHSGIDLWLGVLAFAFQIYGDFSGYTDIARGLSKLMGFELMLNFRLPYFSRSPSEFWQRWHISLSSWLRDYLYISLGGNRKGEFKTYRNLMLTMLLGGLWHGAAWNFVLWGFYHGGLLVAYRWFDEKRIRIIRNGFLMGLIMFGFTLGGWLLFRAKNIWQIGYFVKGLFNPVVSAGTGALALKIAVIIIPLILAEIFLYVKKDMLAPARFPVVLRALFYCLLFMAILVFGVREGAEFIYFQF
ncbi:MAG: membrane bound O-acyl transferase MBOAT family protein [Bacteroidetes bacterium]|nr:MAG: membrane bound O-acyl transferase MBOAT family protein [Bacteroidota bacterium]